MNRSRLVLPSVLALALALVASPAAAQGTMTPANAPTGTPSQPPPAAPPVAPPPAAAPPTYAPSSGSASTTEPPPSEATHGAPPASTGFQIAIRTGVAVPLGEVDKGENMSDFFGPQFGTTLDIGGKPIPQLFIGAYLGGNVGGSGGKTSDTLCKGGVTCTVTTARIGVEIQYHIIPDGKVNPWVGYGIGYEASQLKASGGGSTLTATLGGPEFAHLMGGVDFRLTKVFGIGPFVDFSLGQYSSAKVEGSGGASKSGDIANKTMHQWLTLGAKFVFFP